MEKVKLIEKLKDKANISYDEAEEALENGNWDMLDAMLYLEDKGKVEKPLVGIYYTNEYKDTYKDQVEIINLKKDKGNKHSNNKNNFEGVFEAICKAIDTCNNIFIEIKKASKVFLKIPLTVLIVISFFAFWIIIPLVIVALIFDIEFFVSSKNVNTDKINKGLKDISINVKNIKDKLKKEFNK